MIQEAFRDAMIRTTESGRARVGERARCLPRPGAARISGPDLAHDGWAVVARSRDGPSGGIGERTFRKISGSCSRNEQSVSANGTISFLQ